MKWTAICVNLDGEVLVYFLFCKFSQQKGCFRARSGTDVI